MSLSRLYSLVGYLFLFLLLIETFLYLGFGGAANYFDDGPVWGTALFLLGAPNLLSLLFVGFALSFAFALHEPRCKSEVTRLIVRTVYWSLVVIALGEFIQPWISAV